MLKYIVKKAVSVLTVLFIVSFVTFFIIHLTPGDPARIMLGADAPQEAVEALREQMGLNRTLPVQYLEWLNDVLHGDLGTSIFMEGSMSYIIGLRMKPTIVLTLCALGIAVIIAIPTGIMAATAPADIMSHLRSYSPTRDASETGSVLLLEVVNMTANKYSFQELMNT